MKANWIKSTIWVGVLLLLGISGYGCGSSGGLDDVGGGIVLIPSSLAIPADGKSSTVITATITTTGGIPAGIGTQATFNTTLGKFSTGSTSYTGTIGNATGTLTVTLISSTTVGTAQVTCSAGGASSMIEIYFGDSSTNSIVLSSEKPSVDADGIDSTTITATVTDGLGRPKIGSTVQFTTSLGFFSNDSRGYSAVTNSGGQATATLFAGTSVGTAQITGMVGTEKAIIFVEFGADPDPDPKQVAAIALVSETTEISANGIDSTQITATLTDVNGIPVKSGTSVSFATTLGKFSNNSTAITAYTEGETGVAVVTLFAGTTAGNAQVTASSGSVRSVVYISFTDDPDSDPGKVAAIALSAGSLSIDANGTDSTVVTATLTDVNGKKVSSGTSVTFSTNLGAFSNNSKTITATTSGDTGQATATLFAGTTPGSAQVTASSGGVTSNIYIEFNLNPWH